ncbi:MAG: ribonuclease HI [Candidatus Paceibacterota bacterium]
MDEVIIFTDGSSKGNPGPGGWSAIIKADKTFEIGGQVGHTTNNRMELTAAIKALLELGIRNYELGKGKIVVNSDSKYLIDGITKWIHGWQRNGWRTKDRKDVLNRDLWESLDKLGTGKNIEWKYVAGHVGHPENERCDEIAQAFAEGKVPKLNDSR